MNSLALVTGIGLLAAAAGMVVTGMHTNLPAGTTRQGFQASRVQELMRADADRDGEISRGEWSAAGAGLRARWGGGPDVGADLGQAVFARIDADHDERLSPVEIEAAAGRRFDRFDLDHDGALSAAERERVRPR
jgi:hypothetical protein